MPEESTSTYEIIFDVSDGFNYEELNIRELFIGSWLDLQDYLKQMRLDGCYNITANCISA